MVSLWGAKHYACGANARTTTTLTTGLNQPHHMTISLDALQQLAGNLPDLDFSLNSDQSQWLNTEPVQNYLNHYGLNFVAEELCAQHHFGRFKASGFQIATHVFEAIKPKGTVFFIHGFTDSVGLMQHPIRYLLEQQWTVVAFDLPGHGLSSGTQASIDSFDQYRDVLVVALNRCRQALPKPWHAIGQSTGGAVWLNYLGSLPNQQDIDKVCLLAPLIRPKGWALAQWFFPIYRVCVQHMPRKYSVNSHDEAFLHFLQHSDPLQTRVTPMRWAGAMAQWVKLFDSFSVQTRPLLIIQGDDDQTVDFKHNIAAIREKFPHARIKMHANARHQLANESVEFRQPVLDHIGQWLDD